MEVVYLIFSAASVAITSTVFSLALALRSVPLLLRPLFSFSSAADDVDGRDLSDSAAAPLRMYEGCIRHVRRKPCRHAFEYSARYALVDLDRAAAAATSSSSPFLLPFSFFAGHLSPDRARSVAGTDGPVLLLTIPPSVGYEQNPLSVYYCYDRVPAAAPANSDVATGGGRKQTPPWTTTTCLKKCIAEVTNTPWGERVNFVFSPGCDLVAKPLHVSPFMDMLGYWSIHADEPGESLSITISVQHPTLGNYFTATLNAKRVSPSLSPLSPTLFFWLMPQKVAVWIHWQALKLWWKHVSFIQHPRYSNPAYREDALQHDQELHCSLRNGKNKSTDLNSNDYSSTSTGDGKSEARWCVWRDAEWPWS